MSEVAKYLFKSWARKGIAANIAEPDTLGQTVPPAGERASIKLSVDLNAGAVTKDFTLIGPSDIIGIHNDMIIRTEPLNWITNYEPNYLPLIEFYDEDFPWRYTPAAPVSPIPNESPYGEKLRPWIVLLVLKEEEFKDTEKKLPLTSITVKKQALPLHTETHLWAHVHFDEDITGTFSDLEKFLNSLNKKIFEDPDKIYSRLMSPRHLDANTAYHAFVVPAFEGGRLSGLNQNTEGVPAQKSSWDGSNDVEFPVYFRWFFRTSENEDFEELVKKLQPRVMPKEVGIRDMDVSKPGFVQVDSDGKILKPAGKEIPVSGADPSVMGLEGAIKSPKTKPLPLDVDFLKLGTDRSFYEQVENLVNFPEKIRLMETEDPIVSIPFYGQNHARQKKEQSIVLDVDNKGWYHDLNRDPRNRTAAGFGTGVIQKHQESYMQKAWVQLEKVMELNRLMRQTKAIATVAMQIKTKYLDPLKTHSLLAITALVHTKIMGSPTTIRHQIRESQLPEAVFSAAFRRMMRPNGKLVQRMDAVETFDYQQLVEDLNEGKVSAAPPKETPSVLPTVEALGETQKPKPKPALLQWLIDNALIVLIILLFILLFLMFFTGNILLFGILALAAIAAYFNATQEKKQAEEQTANADILTDSEKALEIIKTIPERPNFNITIDGEDPATTPAPTPTIGSADSVEAKNFRTALTDFHTRLAIKLPTPAPLQPLNLVNAYTKVQQAIHPHASFPLQLASRVTIPVHLNWTLQIWEQITPAMAHPDFEDPMYKPLRDKSKELLLPNIELIKPDTISLLETNPKFIESYLVGLNHEMGRELLWREYPTDLRGSYFRQFWDVKGIIAPTATAVDADDLKDITKIHTWQSFTDLGAHRKGGKKEKLVLIIRGELLKKYPNTVIYAQKALADPNPQKKFRIREEPTHEEFVKEFKFPIFKAEVDPDIKFFGFELTIEEAQGTAKSADFPASDMLGWFFIIQQIPGEPRFGMDISYKPNDAAAKDTWDNVAWNKLPNQNEVFIKSTNVPTLDLTTAEKTHPWGFSSSEMAYILFQKPVMVAVHATEMLDNVV